MKKKEYKKPAMQVVLLQHKCQLLTGSNDLQGVPYWGGEGNAPAFDWVEKGNQFGGWDVE